MEKKEALNFTAKTYQGEDFELASLRGKKIFLSFYRYASCPLCNFRVHELLKHQEEFQAQGLHMVAVFQSPAENGFQAVAKQNPNLPLIADPEQKLYALYNVRTSWARMMGPGVLKAAAGAARLGFLPEKMDGPLNRIPADFYIDENFVIQKAYYGKDIADHLPIDELLNLLKS